MFNLIKRGVKEMAKTVNNMISNNNEVELAKIKLAEGCIKGVGNAVKSVGNGVSNVAKGVVNVMKDSHARRVIGVVGIAVSVGLIASSYV